MSQQTKDMTAGKPLQLIVTFALPLMVGNIFQQLYTVVDTMVVGKALGVDALAALGATDWLYWMYLGIVQGVTQGFGILMAQKFGARQYEALRSVVGGSVLLSGISAILLLLIGQGLTAPVLALLKTPETIMDTAVLYLRIMVSGLPIVMAYNLLACVLRALGDGKTPLYAMIAAALSNIVLDLLFVLVFHWGIAGAAAATLIAQLISCGFCYIKIRKIEFLQLTKSHFRIQRGMAWHLIGLGSPMAMQNAIIAIGGMIIQLVVNGYGVAFIGGFTAANKLYGVLEIAATSYGYAMITYVGQNIGAGRIDRIRKGMTSATAISIATSVLIGTVMLIFGKHIIGAFISGNREDILQATQVGVTYLSFMAVCLPVLYVLHVSRSAVQGMGNTVLPMVSGIAEFCMRTGGVILLPMLMGENGVFLAEVLAWAGADVILIPSYFYMIRKISK